MTKTPSPSQVHAHRGVSAHAPENTLAAFRAARDAGAKWVEFDVTLLADGEVVVFHDSTLDRCTDATGQVQALTASRLADIDAGVKFSAEFAGERIPTLAQTLETLREYGLGANLEIKRHLHDADIAPLVKAVHRILADYADVPTMISSFSVEALRQIHALSPDLELAMLWVHVPPDWREILDSVGTRHIHLYYKSATPDLLRFARQEGITVRVWTCDDPQELVDLWPLGLDAVITNDPSRFLT